MTVQCACCEKSVEETGSVRLLHKADVTICFDCLSWLNTQHDRHVRAHSAGWVVTAHEPVFVVADMPKAADHYAKLGFDVTFHDDSYAFAEHGALNLHLELTEDDGPRPGGGVLYVPLRRRRRCRRRVAQGWAGTSPTRRTSRGASTRGSTSTPTATSSVSASPRRDCRTRSSVSAFGHGRQILHP